MSDGQGLSSEDFRKRAAILTLRRERDNKPTDPIEEANQIAKQVAATSILRRTRADVEADALESEVKRLELETRKQELQQQARRTTGEDPYLQVLSSQMESLQKELAETKATITKQQQESLEGQLHALSEEIKALKETPLPVTEDPLTTVRTKIEEARSLVQLVTPEEVVPRTDDPTIHAWMLRAKFDSERITRELDYRHEERLEELRTTRDIEERKLKLQEEHYGRIERGVTDSLPEITRLLQKVVEVWGNRSPQASPQATSPQASPTPSAPPGAEAMACQQCGTTIYYKVGWPGVICSHCGGEYSWTPSPDSGQAPETPQGEEPSL